MIDALYIGETGLTAMQRQLDVISNNMANVNTNGFKKSRVDFEDVLYRTINQPNQLIGLNASNQKIGSGTAIASTEKIFVNGDLQATTNQLDFAINGTGFFEVEIEDGAFAYTRNGAFRVNSDGLLTTTDGNVLSDTIQIPVDARSIAVNQSGEVFADIPDESEFISIGQLSLSKFVNPAGLDPVGNNLLLATGKSGDSSNGIPGENGLGTIQQGFLETSNVQLTEEIVNLVLTQQAFQLNARVVQAADELMNITNDLFR
jgi:flagellar basal-body rod protein FlgG